MQPATRDAIAGAVSGAASLAITFPLYSVVVKLQTAQSGKRQTLAQTLSEVQWFKGLKAALVAVFVQSGIYYWSYETFASAYRLNADCSAAHLLFGFEAGVATTLLTNPLWVVNSRQMTETAASKTRSCSMLRALAVILREEGPSGLWSGLIPALVLTANPAIQFSVAQYVSKRLRNRTSTLSVTTQAFVVGAVSKLISTLVTYPLQTLKMCLQKSEDEKKGDFRWTNPLQALAAIVRRQGVFGLYRGCSVKLMQTVLTAALLFSFRDNIRIGLDAVLRSHAVRRPHQLASR